MTEFSDCVHIAAMAAAVIEERFAVAELAELEQGFHRFGDFPADEGGLVAVDFL